MRAEHTEQDLGIAEGTPKEVPKSKLKVIRASLQARPDLYMPPAGGEVVERQDFSGVFHQVVDIIVAPRVPVFDPDELNAFMDGLVEDIEPDFRRPAEMWERGDFGLGVLLYDEVLAKKKEETKTTIETEDPELLEGTGIRTGVFNSEINQKWTRQTRLRVYPDPISAFLIYEYAKAKNEGRLIIASGDVDLARHHFLTAEQLESAKRVYRREPNYDRIALAAGPK